MAILTANNSTTTLNPATYFHYNAWDFNAGDFDSWDAINVGAFVINPQTTSCALFKEQGFSCLETPIAVQSARARMD